MEILSLPFFLNFYFMNKKRLLLILLSISGMLSCTRQEATVDIPHSLTITARLGSDASKVGLVDEGYGDLQWLAGDELSVFDQNNLTSAGGYRFETTSGGSVAEFTCIDGPDQLTPRVFAVYPHQDAAVFKDGTLCVEYPAVQKNSNTGDNIVFPLLLLSASDDADNMIFHNACSGIRFTLYRNDVTRIVLKGNNDETLAGTAAVIFNADNSFRVSAITDGGSKSVELVSDEPFTPDTYYYLSFIPGSFNHGFTFEFYSADGALIKSTGTDSHRQLNPGVFGTIKYIDDQNFMDRIKDGEDISSSPSNCYIVNKSGSFKFRTCKGNKASELIAGASTAEVLWSCTSDFKFDADAVVTKVELGDGFVYFSTPYIQQKGNAVIAVRDSEGTVLWSWHIWSAPDYNPDKNVYDFAGNTLMDRNIGAFSYSGSGDDIHGMLYQWGRKDPFPGYIDSASKPEIFSKEDSGATASPEYSFAHPTTFITSETSWYDTAEYGTELWTSSVKSYLDPCPAGWRVPASGMYSGAFSFSTSQYGIRLKDSSDTYVWFPLCGMINGADGVFSAYHSEACYWTSDAKAMYLQLDSRTVGFDKEVPSATGASVRCVKE